MGNLARAIANAIVTYKGGSYTVDTLAELIDKDINNVSVKVWREDKRILLPVYGKEGDACCDVILFIQVSTLLFLMNTKWNFVHVVI